MAASIEVGEGDEEQLRLILRVKDQRAIGMLQKWIAWECPFSR